MIAATGIQDQELAVASEWTSVNDPPVAGRRDLSTRTGGDRLPFLGSTDAIRAAEFACFHAIDRQPQATAHGGKGDRRRQPARILERRERRARRVFLDGTGLLVGVPHRR